MKVFILALAVLMLSGAPFRAASDEQTADPIIVLERESDVFQVSPEYRLSIFEDGTVLFQGKKHVKSQEPIRTRIDREQLTKLLAEFDRIKYYSLRERYYESEDGCKLRGTDQPFATTTLNLNGRKKSIVHYYGCWEEGGPHVVFPQELFKLEAKIDEVVNTKQWLE